MPHVRISPWGEKQGVVDESLSKTWTQADTLHLQLPSVLAAPYTILHSELNC